MSLYLKRTELRIPFFDVDPMGIVWHGNYVKYMEVARCDLFDELNYTYIDMKNDGYAYPIAKMETKFIEPTTFNQDIIIETSLEELEPAIKMKYTFFDKKTGKKVFRAETLQIAVDINTRESKYEAPKRLKDVIKECK